MKHYYYYYFINIMSGEHINEDSYLAHEIKAEEIKRLYPYYT